MKLCYFDEDELMNMFDELMKNEIVLFDELMNWWKKEIVLLMNWWIDEKMNTFEDEDSLAQTPVQVL